MARQEVRGLLHQYTLIVDHDGEWVHSDSPEPDPNWRHVDNAGHGHFYDKGNYPTLMWVSEPCSMGHGSDCDSEGWFECKICSEKIIPGTRIPQDVWVAGRRTLTLKGPHSTYVGFSPEHMNHMLSDLDNLIRDRMEPYLVEQRYTR